MTPIATIISTNLIDVRYLFICLSNQVTELRRSWAVLGKVSGVCYFRLKLIFEKYQALLYQTLSSWKKCVTLFCCSVQYLDLGEFSSSIQSNHNTGKIRLISINHVIYPCSARSKVSCSIFKGACL